MVKTETTGLTIDEKRQRFEKVISRCRDIRAQKAVNLAFEKLDPMRWTFRIPLSSYKTVRWVPDIVNVVSLSDLIPVNKDTLLPLDLFWIAKCCDGTYYAPHKFAAVQAGILNPKSRILIFHTGRIVQTGTTSVIAARVAIMLTLKMLADRAGLHLRATNFKVINIVGAVALNTLFNCEKFAHSHSDECAWDPVSFVGLTYKPNKERWDLPIIVEIYSTGRANIPGAKSEHQLYRSFAKLLPELIKYSSTSANESTTIYTSDNKADEADLELGDETMQHILHTGEIGRVSMRF